MTKAYTEGYDEGWYDAANGYAYDDSFYGSEDPVYTNYYIDGYLAGYSEAESTIGD